MTSWAVTVRSVKPLTQSLTTGSPPECIHIALARFWPISTKHSFNSFLRSLCASGIILEFYGRTLFKGKESFVVFLPVNFLITFHEALGLLLNCIILSLFYCFLAYLYVVKTPISHRNAWYSLTRAIMFFTQENLRVHLIIK